MTASCSRIINSHMQAWMPFSETWQRNMAAFKYFSILKDKEKKRYEDKMKIMGCAKDTCKNDNSDAVKWSNAMQCTVMYTN